ncbi:MAG: calcium-binding protein, partial [Rhodobacteraceae bacterium]|nr:calcium-binding protein [Paracoccaceae bacterium]
SDTILGDAGNDSIAGGAGADRLHGGAGDDTVDGSGDGTADYLAGGDGADALVIGAGDQARGGSGPDAFILSRAENAAVPEILDYAGDDRIELEYEPATGADGQPLPPVLTVAMGPDQAYAVIILDGAPVAHVAGPAAANLTAENIRLVAA